MHVVVRSQEYGRKRTKSPAPRWAAAAVPPCSWISRRRIGGKEGNSGCTSSAKYRCILGGTNGHTAVAASRTRLPPTSTSKRSIPRLPTLASSSLLTPWLATQKQRSPCELAEKVKLGRGAFKEQMHVSSAPKRTFAVCWGVTLFGFLRPNVYVRITRRRVSFTSIKRKS